jgi:hypothetical protein
LVIGVHSKIGERADSGGRGGRMAGSREPVSEAAGDSATERHQAAEQASRQG